MHIRVPNTLDPDQARHLSGQIWVQIVSKGYQQTKLIGKELFFIILTGHQI